MLLTLDQTFDFQGQNIAWGCIGKGDPVVLVHGFPWSAQAWRNIAPYLAQHKTVYFFDMVGCGQSDKFHQQDVSAAVQNNLLAALIDHWNLDTPEVVAHDFGGLAALRAYYINQLRYRKLTLIDTVAVLPSGSPFFAHVREYEAAFAGLPAYAHKALFMAYIQQTSCKGISDQAAEIYAQPYSGDSGQPAFYRQISQSSAEAIAEIQPQYGTMEGVVNVIWGAEDTFIPLNQGEEIAGLLEADNFTVVPEASHLIQEDAPEAIVAALLAN